MLDKIIQRIIRLVKLDTTVFTEIEHDEGANVEALIVVLVATFVGAIGPAVVSGRFVGALLGGFVAGVVGWLLWSLVTWLVGTRLFQGQATFWGMARTLGYATAPQIIALLAIIPCGVGWLAVLAAGILSLVVGFFAVRETLGVTTEKALLTILLGWAVMFVVGFIF